MTIQRKFILFFTGFTLLVTLAISAISIGFLKETYDRIVNAANASFLPVMASHMFFKATLTFVIISLIVVAVSIPLGILLSRLLSAPYLRIFENLGSLAKSRLAIESTAEFTTDERKVLEKYISLLIEDLKNLKEYEKTKSWKDGARMLMHELKNPLTPLKLSAQSLSIGCANTDESSEHTSRILNSITDIEKILVCFKELVNIEFGPKIPIDAKGLVESILRETKTSRPFSVSSAWKSETYTILSEPVLLKMLFTNLINNGLAENCEKFIVFCIEKETLLKIHFITPNRRITDPSKLFKLGFSTKGKEHGFGLFLCKKISDYLDLNLRFLQKDDSVIFSIDCKRHESC